MMSNEESVWIDKAREGDQSAFGLLVQAYQKPVFNLTYRMLGNAQEAEDAAQETFLRAYSSLRQYQFGLRGTIERVTNRVFLLSPNNVQVTAEDKAKIAEGGFFNQS